MLVLLPPSETKRDGGALDRLDLSSLSFAGLKTRRAELVRAVRLLARDADATIAALKLGRTLGAVEVERNRRLTLSPTMPALDRYTGVVFDALSAESLPVAARQFAGAHVAVHSALFGPIRVGDSIPAYRLSHDSRVPGLPLKKHWAAAASAVLAREPGLLLDFRSEGYVALGPVDARPNTHFLRVFSVGTDGKRRALNHFNKKAKGELTRALVLAGVDFASVDELLAWAPGAGFDLRLTPDGDLALMV
ncbi:YaaA family protein [Subtercola vilae]|uniref:Peroxide stress protein YaaA n=1 Tax=Subtercola vilae TaxID=2056433 RepID=A0A4T2BS81_9MICO|nr:peroxide stress protein YaaA [Subtercola vilae]TIH34525.1 peroxide stress protein YaaA [Subtercola vilae]